MVALAMSRIDICIYIYILVHACVFFMYIDMGVLFEGSYDKNWLQAKNPPAPL